MQSLTAGMVIAANLYSLVWLLTFRRGCATYKLWVSVAAWLLVLALGGQVVEVGLNHAMATVADVGLATLIALFIHRARGNVACLVQGRECIWNK